MNYETFVYRVAMEFSGYLPKGLEQYHTLIKADKKGNGRDAYLTIERDKVEYIRSIELYPYYLNYLSGEKLGILLAKMVEELIKPKEKETIEKQSTLPKSRASILAAGGLVLCMAIEAICNHKKRKRGLEEEIRIEI